MSHATTKELKAERLEVRLTPAAKSLLTTAAQARHTTVTDFLVSSAVKAAEEVLTSINVFYATENGWNELMNYLDEPENT